MYIEQLAYEEDVRSRECEQEQEQEQQSRMDRQWEGFVNGDINGFVQLELLMIEKQLSQDIEQQQYEHQLDIDTQNISEDLHFTNIQPIKYSQQQQQTKPQTQKLQQQMINSPVEQFVNKVKMSQQYLTIIQRWIFIVLVRWTLLQLMDRLLYVRLWKNVSLCLNPSLSTAQQPPRIFYLLMARMITKLKHSQANTNYNYNNNTQQSEFIINKQLFNILVVRSIVDGMKWTIIELVGYYVLNMLIIAVVDNSYLLCILQCVIGICFGVFLLMQLISVIFSTTTFLITLNHDCHQPKQLEDYIGLIIKLIALNRQKQQVHSIINKQLSLYLHNQHHQNMLCTITNKLLNLSEIEQIALIVGQQMKNYLDQMYKLLVQLSQQRSNGQENQDMNTIKYRLYSIAQPLISNKTNLHCLVKLKRLPKVFYQLQLYLLNAQATTILSPTIMHTQSLFTLSSNLSQLHIIYLNQLSFSNQFIFQLSNIVQLNNNIETNATTIIHQQPQLFISRISFHNRNTQNTMKYRQSQSVRLLNQMLEFYHVFLYLVKYKIISLIDKLEININSNNNNRQQLLHKEAIKFIGYVEESLSLKIFHLKSKLNTLTNNKFTTFKNKSPPMQKQPPALLPSIINDDDDNDDFIISKWYELQPQQRSINSYPSRYLTMNQNELHEVDNFSQYQEQLIVYEKFVKGDDSMQTLDVIVERLVQRQQLLTINESTQGNIPSQRYNQLQEQLLRRQSSSDQQQLSYQQQQQQHYPNYRQNIFSRQQFAFNFNLQQEISQLFTNTNNKQIRSSQNEIKQYQ